MADIPRKTRELVYERDGYACRRCGVNATVCGLSIHHRQGRQCARPNNPANLVTLCGSGTTGCHGWATDNPAEAYETGWCVRRTGGDDPAGVPLVDLFGVVFGLTEDGDVVEWGNAAPIYYQPGQHLAARAITTRGENR